MIYSTVEAVGTYVKKPSVQLIVKWHLNFVLRRLGLPPATARPLVLPDALWKSTKAVRTRVHKGLAAVRLDEARNWLAAKVRVVFAGRERWIGKVNNKARLAAVKAQDFDDVSQEELLRMAREMPSLHASDHNWNLLI